MGLKLKPRSILGLQNKIHNRGFSLAEVTLAGAILGVIVVGSQKMLLNSARLQNQVSFKGDLNQARNRISYLTVNQDSCMAVLFGSNQPNFDPANSSTFNASSAANLTLNLPGGNQVSAGGTLDGVPLRSIKLEIGAEVPPVGNGNYEGRIILSPNYGGNATISDSIIGLVLFTQSGANGTRTVTKCTTGRGTNDDPQVMCTHMGGKWIESLNRCHWGGSLKVSRYESIAATEFQVGGPLEGAIISDCLYKDFDSAGNGTMKTWKCPVRGPSNSVGTCDFQNTGSGSTSGWGLRKGKTTRTLIYGCDGGVLIYVPDVKEKFLESDELVAGTAISSSLTASDQQQYKKILPKVMECLADDQGNKRFNCDQGGTEAKKAFEMGAGSCVFVENAVAWDKETSKLSNYSGWMRVITAPSLISSTYNTTVQQAYGRKCYAVKVYTGDSPSATVSSNELNLITKSMNGSNTLVAKVDGTTNNLGLVRHCLLRGTGSITYDTVRNVSKGNHLMRYFCNQKMDPLDERTLKSGDCFYFKNVTVATKFRDNIISGTSLSTSTYSSFTGWAYVVSGVSTYCDSVLTTLDQSIAVTDKVISGITYQCTLNVIPCTGGIEVEDVP